MKTHEYLKIFIQIIVLSTGWILAGLYLLNNYLLPGVLIWIVTLGVVQFIEEYDHYRRDRHEEESGFGENGEGVLTR
jgi:hypothetical protein